MTDTVRRELLARWGGPDGVIVGLAIDHRDALIAAWRRRTGVLPAHDEVEALKSRAVRALAGEATALLLDAEYGGAAIRGGLVPPSVALVMPLEEQGYEAVGDGRVTRLMTGFTPRDAAGAGAAGCKLLLPYRPDDLPSASLQDEVARRAIDACHEADLPLVIEPIVYARGGEPDETFAARTAELVTTSAQRLAGLGPDLLKLQFPAGTRDDAAACRALSDACGGVPWVLLGAGADPDTFAHQVSVARGAGALGFMVGRTVWGSALVAGEGDQQRALDSEARPMLRRFARIARTSRHRIATRT